VHYGQNISGVVTINRLYIFINALSNVSIADHPPPHQTGVYTDPPQILGLQIAAKPLQMATLTAYIETYQRYNGRPNLPK